VKTYRIFCFDGASRIISADWLGADNDAEALETGKQALDCINIEAWEPDRLVGRIERSEHEFSLCRRRWAPRT